MTLKYNSLAEIVALAEAQGIKISELVLQQQCEEMETDKGTVYAKMAENLLVMEQSVIDGSKEGVRSTSGLTGGNAFKMAQQVKTGQTICGDDFGNALVKAIAVSELNAAMGRIVASPTAGSCGILPAAVLTALDQGRATRDECIMSLFTASAVGLVIAHNACLAGAQGGCQAECGSASAMAAAALVELMGGTPRMAEHAVAIAIKNILGLVCDPVAGLVEIPCIMRNAGGIANALVAAELALAGVTSAIPADEVIVTMKRVGDALPATLRETAMGGLAATPTGKKLFDQVFGGPSVSQMEKTHLTTDGKNF